MNKKSLKSKNIINDRQKLYQALVFMYQIYDLEELCLLKKEKFLNICGVPALDFSFTNISFNKDFLKKSKALETLWVFQHVQELSFNGNFYGEIFFYSSQSFSQSKKKFLKKVSAFISSCLYFLENKEKLSYIKTQWVDTFDSFPQSFCITDQHFKIIRSNQAFQKLFQKNKQELFSQNLFAIFPFFVKPISELKKTSSFIAKGNKGGKQVYWKISCKNLYLQKEQTQTLIFLIKDISQEMEFEAKISAQSKEQEIGWIKGSLAHELNNPIAGIKLLLSVLEKEIKSEDKQIKEDLMAMQESLSNCHKVVQNLLSISKQESDPFLASST